MNNDTERIYPPATQENADHFQALTINYELYERYLEGSDLDQDQKREFIDTLWSIIVSFVDLGFGVHPVSQACDQNTAIRDFLTSDIGDVVKSQEHTPKTKFAESAKHRKTQPAERLEQ